MVDLSEDNFELELLGQKLAWPLMVAPIGFMGMTAPRGEAKAARAAAQAGIPFIQSSMSICPLEEVADYAGTPQWFQLYVFRDRSIVKGMLERLQAVGCPVLVLTVDLTVMGKRERDVRSGFIVGHKLSGRSMLDIAAHPRWALDMGLHGRPIEFGNLKELPGIGKDIMSQAHFATAQADLTLSWKDIAWVKSMWPGKLVLKGIMTPEDAREAANLGADGIIVSNHGGRQLDGASSSIMALKAIVDAVGDEVDVLFDGGIRRGSDIAKAIAIGAKACLIGRAMVWGLAAGGETGAAHALQMLRTEFRMATAFMGMTRYEQLLGNRDCLILRE
jgi:L-lactate dehydrogenase (cytochrome)